MTSTPSTISRTRRRTATIVGSFVGILAVLFGVLPGTASAADKMTCTAYADDPVVAGPGKITAQGSAAGRPGTVGGLAVLGQNVRNVGVVVSLMKFDPQSGLVYTVDTDSDLVEGSLLGRLLNDTSKLEAGAVARRTAGEIQPTVQHYWTKVSAVCTATNGTQLVDEDQSGELLSFIG